MAAAAPPQAPLIGVTCGREQGRWREWSEAAYLLSARYVEAIRETGGTPVLLPGDGDPATVERVVAALDGLLLSGGPDLDPSLYGAEPDPRTSAAPERDRFELALLATAERAGLPVLGVCRGMQAINVHRGGSLVQHVPDRVGHEEHQRRRGSFLEHRVEVAAGGPLAGLLGPAPAVASYHHQGVERLGDGLTATAWAPDGTIEAFEDGGREHYVGVLWHPERERRPAVLGALVEAAGAREGVR